jgi:hypothetical protein
LSRHAGGDGGNFAVEAGTHLINNPLPAGREPKLDLPPRHTVKPACDQASLR